MVVGRGLMVRWLWSDGVIWFCGSGFRGLISWVWVLCFDFSRVIWFCDLVGSWVSDWCGHWRWREIGVGHRLGFRCGSSSWSVWVSNRHGSLIIVVVIGIVVAGGWPRGREDEKNKNKKGIKNNKEIIFKWICKKKLKFWCWVYYKVRC